MILKGLYCVWIIGCVACLIAFMFVFFSSRKTIFKSLLDTSSTPGYLSSFQAFFYRNLDTWWIDRESSCLLDSFSIARSIDRAFVLDMVVCSSTHARHLHLSMAIFSTPNSTYFSTPLDTFICRDLLMAYIFSLCDPHLISVDLSLDTSVFSSPKPLSLNPNLFPNGFSSLIKFFLTWYVFNLSFSCISFS